MCEKYIADATCYLIIQGIVSFNYEYTFPTDFIFYRAYDNSLN